jgi:hypothetical protein
MEMFVMTSLDVNIPRRQNALFDVYVYMFRCMFETKLLVVNISDDGCSISMFRLRSQSFSIAQVSARVTRDPRSVTFGKGSRSC